MPCAPLSEPVLVLTTPCRTAIRQPALAVWRPSALQVLFAATFRSITARLKSLGPACFSNSVYRKAVSSAESSVQSPMPRTSMEPWMVSSAPSASMWVRRRPHRTIHQPSQTESETRAPSRSVTPRGHAASAGDSSRFAPRFHHRLLVQRQQQVRVVIPRVVHPVRDRPVTEGAPRTRSVPAPAGVRAACSARATRRNRLPR